MGVVSGDGHMVNKRIFLGMVPADEAVPMLYVKPFDRALHPVGHDLLGHLSLGAHGSGLGDRIPTEVARHLGLGADLHLPRMPGVSAKFEGRRKQLPW